MSFRCETRFAEEESGSHIFFHPDYTVGTGITPVQLARADFTAGRELHPALKTFSFICLQRYYTTAELFCNIFLFRIACDIIQIYALMHEKKAGTACNVRRETSSLRTSAPEEGKEGDL